MDSKRLLTITFLWLIVCCDLLDLTRGYELRGRGHSRRRTPTKKPTKKPKKQKARGHEGLVNALQKWVAKMTENAIQNSIQSKTNGTRSNPRRSLRKTRRSLEWTFTRWTLRTYHNVDRFVYYQNPYKSTRSIYQNSKITPRPSGHVSRFGLVFFVLNNTSLFWELRDNGVNWQFWPSSLGVMLEL